MFIYHIYICIYIYVYIYTYAYVILTRFDCIRKDEFRQKHENYLHITCSILLLLLPHYCFTTVLLLLYNYCFTTTASLLLYYLLYYYFFGKDQFRQNHRNYLQRRSHGHFWYVGVYVNMYTSTCTFTHYTFVYMKKYLI